MPKVNPIDSAMRHSEVLWFHFSIKICQTNCRFCIKQNKWWIELTMEVRVWPVLAWLMNWTTVTHELNFAAKWTEHIKLLTSLYLVQILFPLIQVVWYYSRSFFQLGDVLKINSLKLRKIGMESVRFKIFLIIWTFIRHRPFRFRFIRTSEVTITIRCKEYDWV